MEEKKKRERKNQLDDDFDHRVIEDRASPELEPL